MLPSKICLPKNDLNEFCELKPHAKFKNPRATPSGRKVTQVEEEEKEREMIARRTTGAKECSFSQDLYTLYFSFHSNQKYNLQRI